MTIIVANLYKEYLAYCAANNLQQCKSAMFINSPRKLEGFSWRGSSKPKVVFLPSHTELPNLQSIKDELAIRGWTPAQ